MAAMIFDHFVSAIPLQNIVTYLCSERGEKMIEIVLGIVQHTNSRRENTSNLDLMTLVELVLG